MRMREVLLWLCVVVMVSSLEAFIDCETSCNKCKENADDPEIIDVYCSMCSECTQRIEALRASREQDAQSYEENGHKEYQQEDITPMPPLFGVDDVSNPDQTKEALGFEKLLRPRRPALRIGANQWRNNQMPRLRPAATATQPAINKPKRQRMPLKQRAPVLREPVEVEARVQGNSCPFAQDTARKAVPGALRQEYLDWPEGCPIPPICSDDDSSEEVTRRVPAKYLHGDSDPPYTKRTSTTTTTTTTTKPTCPPILTCRMKRRKKPMPCAVNCMPMCCPLMPYNGNNGLPFIGNNMVPGIVNNGMPNIGNNAKYLPQYMPQTVNINPNKPNNNLLNAIEDKTGNGSINVPNQNNANGPGNNNLHINAHKDNQGITNVYDPSGNNQNSQNSIVPYHGQMDNGNIQSGLNANVLTGNHRTDQNSNIQNGNHQNAPNGIVQNAIKQNGQHNLQNNGNKNSGSGNQNANNRLPYLIDETKYNALKALISDNQGSKGGNDNGNRVEVSPDYYNLYVGVPLNSLGSRTDPWRRSQ